MPKKIELTEKDIERAKIRADISNLNKRLAGICRKSRGGDYSIIHTDIQTRVFGEEFISNFYKNKKQSVHLLDYLDVEASKIYFQSLKACVDRYNDFYNSTDGIRIIIEKVCADLLPNKFFKPDFNLRNAEYLVERCRKEGIIEPINVNRASKQTNAKMDKTYTAPLEQFKNFTKTNNSEYCIYDELDQEEETKLTREYFRKHKSSSNNNSNINENNNNQNTTNITDAEETKKKNTDRNLFNFEELDRE